jgi:hypothetical protein
MKPSQDNQDDPSSAPESGTNRDDTSGNQSTQPLKRAAPEQKSNPNLPQKDSPQAAGEER